MKAVLKTLLATSIMTSASLANAMPTPKVSYTPEQVKVCAPILKTDADSDAKKSSVGQSVTATATATITADKGYFIDARNGAIAYTNTGGTHMNRPGKPKVTKRVNNFLPKEVSIENSAHRGSSLRTGRNAEAVAALAGFQLKATYECMVAIGLLSA